MLSVVFRKKPIEHDEHVVADVHAVQFSGHRVQALDETKYPISHSKQKELDVQVRQGNVQAVQVVPLEK